MTPRQAREALKALNRQYDELYEARKISRISDRTPLWAQKAMAQLRWHLIHLADEGS